MAAAVEIANFEPVDTVVEATIPAIAKKIIVEAA
jgi:hypothetical protein